ncbi:MAG: hypothetical protein IMX02_03810 [Limnochordaceae bacterium]|nr:hypothetical protein [Limnochordaceae bacterium]
MGTWREELPVFNVSPEDVLRGLKRSKRLAKQDILASSKTPNPRYWTAHAEARRRVYDLLMEAIEREGLDSAYHLARRQFATLLETPADRRAEDPERNGEEQALRLFFAMLGLADQDVDALVHEVTPEAAPSSSSVAVN